MGNGLELMMERQSPESVLFQVGKMLEEQAVDKAIAATNAPEENTSGGIFQERHCLPRKGVRAPEPEA